MFCPAGSGDGDCIFHKHAAAEECWFLVQDYGTFDPVDYRSLPDGTPLLGGRSVF